MPVNYFARTFLPIFLIFLIFPQESKALQSEWATADHIQARLISAVKTVKGQDEVHAALEIRIAEGWHAYWRMPGEGGLPPQFNWEDAENLDSVTVHWPVPERFETAGLYSFGYENSLTLPLSIKPENPEEALKLTLQADIMVCRDICVPQALGLSLIIPPGEKEAPAFHAAVIERAMEKLPSHGDMPGLKIENVVLGPDALVITAFSQRGFENADLFVEAGEDYITAPPEITPGEDDARKAIMRIAAPDYMDNLAEELEGKTVILTFTDGRDAIERRFDF